MDLELVIFVWAPMLLGIVAVAASFAIARRARTPESYLVSILILIAVAWCEAVLYGMARGGWPTSLPHFLLTLALVVVVIQWWHVRRTS
jgi:hypothetical protein